MTLTMKAFRESTLGEASAINDRAIAENRDLTSEEQAKFDALLSAYKTTTGQSVPSDKAAFARFCNSSASEFDPMQLVSATVSGTERTGMQFYDQDGRPHRGVTRGESFAEAVREGASYGRHDIGEKLVADGLTFGGLVKAAIVGPQGDHTRMAALNTGSGTGGGYTVPEFLSATMIDNMRARTNLMRAGAMTIPLQGSTHSYAKLTADPTPAWRQETTEISESEPTFGAIVFRPKSLAVYCKVSQELVNDSLNFEAAIERAFTESFAIEVDRVGMFGTGASAEPIGIYYADDVNAVTSVGTPADYSDILSGYKLLLDDNAPDPTGLIMSPREWLTYANLQDTTTQPMLKPPAIANLPFYTTSAVPTTLGGGSDSAMFLGYFPDFIFGIRSEIQIEVLKELFAVNHEYGFVAHMRMDTALFHAESFCKFTGVTSS